MSNHRETGICQKAPYARELPQLSSPRRLRRFLRLGALLWAGALIATNLACEDATAPEPRAMLAVSSTICGPEGICAHGQQVDIDPFQPLEVALRNGATAEETLAVHSSMFIPKDSHGGSWSFTQGTCANSGNPLPLDPGSECRAQLSCDHPGGDTGIVSLQIAHDDPALPSPFVLNLRCRPLPLPSSPGLRVTSTHCRAEDGCRDGEELWLRMPDNSAIELRYANESTATRTVQGAIALDASDTRPADWIADAGSCASASLAPGESCAVRLTCTNQDGSSGFYYVRFTHDDPNQPSPYTLKVWCAD
ncbi:MAG: hypothetical protein HYV63_07495 [Candidatus Schekmanbacteria bacterium]|nr:hypothetical protein [Candidatus Schekmanbacteria bacterium]